MPMHKMKNPLLLFLSLTIISCSDSVITPSLKSTQENEYSSFTTKALTKSYLARKMKKLLTDPVDGSKVAKEIAYARVKHADLLVQVFMEDQTLYPIANPLAEVQSRRNDPLFDAYMDRLAGNSPVLSSEKISFITGGEIYIMDPDGGNKTRVTNNSTGEQNPIISPDGSKILFHDAREFPYEIYLINPDGTGEIRLTNAPGDKHPASWSPDGSKIAYDNYNEGHGNIFTIEVNNPNNIIRLTNNNSFNDNFPTWSPDGSRMAFVSDRDGAGDVYVMNITDSDQDGNGDNIQRLPTIDTQAYFTNWSPDGSKITFAAFDGSKFQIYILDANGDNLTLISDGSSDDRSPSWSPDSSKIAFSRFGGIYIMDADGGNVHQITTNGYNELPRWWGPTP
jgi:Tol biopolymer transport system component